MHFNIIFSSDEFDNKATQYGHPVEHNILDFLIKVLAISGNSEHFSFFATNKKFKNHPPRGEGSGVFPQMFSHLNCFLFCNLKPNAKFHNTRTTPSGRKVCVGGSVEVNLLLRFGPNH